MNLPELGRVRRSFHVLLAAAFAIFLIIPATRELFWMDARLLLHLRGKVVVQGQPDQCTLVMIPNTVFSEAYQEQVHSNSAASIDNYLLALAGGSWGSIIPPTATNWAGHPLQEWATIRMAAQASAYAATLPEHTKVAVALAETAYQVHPENGAYALALAAAKFAARDTNGGLEAARIASVAPEWTLRSRAQWENDLHCIARVLTRQGLSKLDAYSSARNMVGNHTHFSITRLLKHYILDAFVAAGARADHEQARSILDVLRGLQARDWSDETIGNSFQSFSLDLHSLKNLATALSFPTRDVELEESSEAATNLVVRYMVEKLGMPASQATLNHTALDPGQMAKLAELRQERSTAENSLLKDMLWSFATASISGAIGVLAMAWCCISALAFTPLRFTRERSGAKRFPREPCFWLILAGVLVLSGLILSNLSPELFGPMGFRSLGPEEVSAERREALITKAVCWLIASSWIGIRLLLWREGYASRANRLLSVVIGWQLPAVVALTVIAVSAFYRELVLRLLLTTAL